MAQFAFLNRRQARGMENCSLSIPKLLFIIRAASCAIVHHKWRILYYWLIHNNWVFRVVIVGLLMKQRLLFHQLCILFNGFLRIFFCLFLCLMQKVAYFLPREKCAFCHPQQFEPQRTYLPSLVLLMRSLRRLNHRILVYTTTLSLAGVSQIKLFFVNWMLNRLRLGGLVDKIFGVGVDWFRRFLWRIIIGRVVVDVAMTHIHCDTLVFGSKSVVLSIDCLVRIIIIGLRSSFHLIFTISFLE